MLPATITHSHPSFKKNNPLHPFFNKSDPLPLIFQQKWPTLTHFSRKTTHSHAFSTKTTHSTHFPTKVTHSHPIFKKNDLLPPIFWQIRPPPSHFWWKTFHPHTVSTINSIAPIFQQVRPTPTYFSTKTTYSHHSQPFSHRSSTKATCIHQFSNYNRLSLPVTINALNELNLENIIFEYLMSEKTKKAYLRKNQIYPSILLYMKWRQYITW